MEYFITDNCIYSKNIFDTIIEKKKTKFIKVKILVKSIFYFIFSIATYLTDIFYFSKHREEKIVFAVKKRVILLKRTKTRNKFPLRSIGEEGRESVRNGRC